MNDRTAYFFSFLICFMLMFSFFVLPPVYGSVPEETGFSYYVPVTINSTLIDEDLTDFPLLFHLNDSCGTNDFDASPIFDEIGDNYNWSGYSDALGNMFYWEPEYWNSTEMEAYVWVRIPSISSSSDTILYFWFEKFIDGSAYNSPSDVWDSDFVMVCHMNDNPDTSSVMDSTSNDNDGTKKAENEPVEATGKIGKAQDFNYTNSDKITITKTSSINFTSETFTIAFWVNCSHAGNNQQLITDGRFAKYGWRIFWYNTNRICFETNQDGTFQRTYSNALSGNVCYNVVITREGATAKIFVNGNDETASSASHINPDVSALDLYIGVDAYSGGEPFGGLIDEIQILKDIVLSSAWVGASYETQRFNLHGFGSILIFEENLASRGELIAAALVIALISVPLLILIIFAARRRR